MLGKIIALSDRVKVYYFSEDDRLTRTYRVANPDHLKQIASWIDTNVQDYYYTTNRDSVGLLKGKYIKPVSRGINDYQNYHKCVWLASMKPSPVESKLLELMFELSKEDVVKVREYEQLYQFINRSNLRDYDSDSVVEIYVFDKYQALSISDNVHFIDVGLTKSKDKFVPIKLS